MALSPEDREAIGNTIKVSVNEAMEPMWEKIRSHDTSIALLDQDARQGKVSQTAQGERLGIAEKRAERHGLYWKIMWIGLTGFGTFVAWIVGKLVMVLNGN